MNCTRWKTLRPGSAILLAMLPLTGRTQLELLPEDPPPAVFGGETRHIGVMFRNPAAVPFNGAVTTELLQAASSIAAPWGKPHDWKRLQVLPGQMVLESVPLELPPVTAATSFMVRWLEGDERVLCSTKVLVYPNNLLKDLKDLAGGEPLGVLDPQDILKPLLKKAAVEFADLEDAELENFAGKLAILGPFASREQMRPGLARRVQTIARRGVAVVWFQPPPEPRQTLEPSFYLVWEGAGAVVIAQSSMAARLMENPQAQLDLIHFCRLARYPRAAALPVWSEP